MFFKYAHRTSCLPLHVMTKSPPFWILILTLNKRNLLTLTWGNHGFESYSPWSLYLLQKVSFVWPLYGSVVLTCNSARSELKLVLLQNENRIYPIHSNSFYLKDWSLVAVWKVVWTGFLGRWHLISPDQKATRNATWSPGKKSCGTS